jgi:putative membrane protein
MVSHMLLSMVAPIGLVLAAPVTLALRTLPAGLRRALLTLLRSRAATLLGTPLFAAVVNLAGPYALYLSGLYRAAQHNGLLHAGVHLQMLSAGCLLSWAVIGLDPVRRRPTTSTKLAALVTVAAGHDVLAKLLYAHQLPAGGGSRAEREFGAELMYYGSTVFDVLLAVVVMAQWYRAGSRELRRTARASQRASAAGSSAETASAADAQSVLSSAERNAATVLPSSAALAPSSTSRISAEATTAPSELRLTSTACAGEEIPKPTSTGRVVS